MLLWLHKSVSKRWVLFGRIIFLCVTAHLLFLFGAFFMYRGCHDQYAIEINGNLLGANTDVVFLPLYKVVKAEDEIVPVAQEKTEEPIIQEIQEAEEIQEEVTTTIDIEQEEKPVQEKKEIEPELEQKVEEAKPDPIYIGRQQLDALHMQVRMQHEVSKVWQPPVGAPKECECTIKMVVGKNGRAAALEIIESSAVLMYDVSARSAMLAMQLPPWAAGKEFTITFKQA